MTRRTVLGLGFFAVMAGLAGCGGKSEGGGGADDTNTPSTSGTSDAGTPAKEEAKKLTVGYLANIVMAQPLVGFESGEFARALPGVELKQQVYEAGPDVLKALRAGVVDIAYTGPYPPINAYGKAQDVVLLANAANGGTELVVAADSPLKTVADLKGKTVGVNQSGSTVDALVRWNLLQAKLVPGKDVRIIEVKPSEQSDALKRKEVDAVAAPAPWPSQVAINAPGRPLVSWKQLLNDGNYSAAVVFTTRKFAEENPQLVKKFVETHRAITARLNADRAKGDAEVLAAWSKVSKKTLKPDVAKAAFATITYDDKADQKGFEQASEIAVATGVAKKKADLDGFIYEEK